MVRALLACILRFRDRFPRSRSSYRQRRCNRKPNNNEQYENADETEASRIRWQVKIKTMQEEVESLTKQLAERDAGKFSLAWTNPISLMKSPQTASRYIRLAYGPRSYTGYRETACQEETKEDRARARTCSTWSWSWTRSTTERQPRFS